MDDRTLRVLEYDKIKAMLADCAASSLGRRRAEALQPRTDLRWIEDRLAETTEMRRLMERFGQPPFGGLTDVGELIARARVQGILDPEELLRVSDFLRCSRRMREYLERGADLAPRLALLGDSVISRPEIEDEIARCIDDNANVRNNASPELQRLSAQAEVLERRVRDRIESILRRETDRGTLQEPVIVQRDGRFCLPVQSGAQGRFRGIIHDRSDSGATVFMEPLEVVEVGNELRETYLRIEDEVERILREITARIGAFASEFDENLRALGVVDFIGARASLAAKMMANPAKIIPGARINLRGGRHPLIQGNVVPLDIWLGDEFTTLIITGPNTGGKTVTLKTVGLCALMTQSGLHIPADPGSVMPVWEYVYADIGDEQSIEQSLSTFSSHMTQIVKIINRIQAHQRRAGRSRSEEDDVRALVLLDELGAGTDPTEGAALAKAILTELHESGCRTLATTHYNELKAFAYSTEGMQNASVEFDVKTLRPTYRLRIGHAGSSNAFEIAQRLGLARSIVRRGRGFLTDEQYRFDRAVSEVERQRRALMDQTREAASTQRDLERLREQYEKDLEKLEGRRRQALEDGFAEAEAIIRRAEEDARRIIAELQSQTRQSKLTQQGREELAELRRATQRKAEEALEREAPRKSAEEDGLGLDQVLMGDTVHVASLGKDGVVTEIPKDGVVRVQVGNLSIETPFPNLRPAHEPPDRGAEELAQRMQTRKVFTVPREIDIRGATVGEAILDLERYIDDAVLARFPMVRIVHGKGTGALRQGVHEFLRKHKQVRSFRFADHESGGDGATEVYF